MASPTRAGGKAGTGQLLERESRDDQRVLLTSSGLFAGAYAIGSVLQAAYVYAALIDSWSQVQVWQRAAANALAVFALLVALALWRQHRRTGAVPLAVGVMVAAVALAGVRVVAQRACGVYGQFDPRTTLVEFVAALLIGLVSAGIGTVQMLGLRAIRDQARANERLAIERARAVQALEDEEVRVRRAVAEDLHASAQQHLVMLVARLDAVTSRLRTREANAEEVEELDEIRRDLDSVRERDVRGVSQMLYPDQIQVGLVPAVRALLRRVPTSIATHLTVDPAVRAADDSTEPLLVPTERLLAVRVVEEGIGNALRHARPTSVTVTLGIDAGVLAVSVSDDGGGFDAAAIVRSGTDRLAQRLAVVGGELELTSTTGTGATLVGRLPLAGAPGPE